MSTVLVGGGSGFVGKQIIKSLLHSNHRVIVLTREVKSAQTYLMSDPVIKKHSDETHVQFLTWNDLHTVDYPIHAGINVTGKSIFDDNWTPKVKKQLYSSRIDTSKTMIQFLSENQKNGEAVFVGTSAVGYYPVGRPEVFDEYSQIASPDNPLAELCFSIEESIDQESRRLQNVTYSVIRPGAVMGSYGGSLLQMAIPFKFGFEFYPNHGKQPFAFVHVKDLANLYVHTMSHLRSDQKDVMQGPVNGVAPQIITSYDFSYALRKAMHRSFLPMVPVPCKLLRAVLGQERALLLNEGQKVVPTKALKSGFRFEYPTVDVVLQDISKELTLAGAIRGMLHLPVVPSSGSNK